MKRFAFLLLCVSLLASCVKDKLSEADTTDYSSDLFITRTSQQAEGRLSGVFSVSDSTHVYFSKGNLRYVPSTGVFSFANHQWECVGKAGGNVLFTEGRSSCGEAIDLFGWGTSGYDNRSRDVLAVNFAPWSFASDVVKGGKGKNEYGYGPSADMKYPSLFGDSYKYDWGLYNSIANGGNVAGCWRVLSKREWSYLFGLEVDGIAGREDALALYGLATVEDVAGIVIVPDGGACTDGTFVPRKDGGWKFDSNVYTATEWAVLEARGYVFLPAAGSVEGKQVVNVDKCGGYWSSSYSNSEHAFYMGFLQDQKPVDVCARGRYIGRSVRLVQDVAE